MNTFYKILTELWPFANVGFKESFLGYLKGQVYVGPFFVVAGIVFYKHRLSKCMLYHDLWLISVYRLTTSFGRPGSKWNYSFDPCSPFSMPENPNQGFGDKCLSVAVSENLNHLISMAE